MRRVVTKFTAWQRFHEPPVSDSFEPGETIVELRREDGHVIFARKLAHGHHNSDPEYALVQETLDEVSEIIASRIA